MVKISARDIILLYGTIPKVEISPSKKHGEIDERPKVLIHRVILIVNKIRVYERIRSIEITIWYNTLGRANILAGLQKY